MTSSNFERREERDLERRTYWTRDSNTGNSASGTIASSSCGWMGALRETRERLEGLSQESR